MDPLGAGVERIGNELLDGLVGARVEALGEQLNDSVAKTNLDVVGWASPIAAKIGSVTHGSTVIVFRCWMLGARGSYDAGSLSG